jgi:hypothetical protein
MVPALARENTTDARRFDNAIILQPITPSVFRYARQLLTGAGRHLRRNSP